MFTEVIYDIALKMSESGSETKSPDAKSMASRTSINVKIPSAASKRGATPSKSPGLEVPDDIGSRALTTTPVSSKDYQAGNRSSLNQSTNKGLRQPQKTERE